MKQTLITFLLSFLLLSSSAQNDTKKISALISSRVDTNSKDVKAIVQLYENYLNSRPDSIYDNPYWNTKEKLLYEDFDFSRESIFQGGMSPSRLCQFYPPFIMSVEPLGEKYQIRIMYSSATIEPKYAGSKVWCIQKLNAIKENENWVLENLVVELSKKWETKKLGRIEYIYPSTHNFDVEEAKQSISFCADIIKRFNPTYNDSFRYYVSSSIDDMGLLENFDYYFVGSTTGKAREGMILTAKGNEFYPHEFVHQLLPFNPLRGELINEGLATFLGTKNNVEEYKIRYLGKLAFDLKNVREKVNFKSVVSQEMRFNGYQTSYPGGAAICELVFNHSGDQGLIQLVKGNTSDYDNIMLTVRNITKLTNVEVVKRWEEVVLQYLQ